MRFAVLSADQQFVDNVIVANENQKEELEAALGRTLLNAAPLGLTVGDYFNGANWTRNVDGEQIVLPIAVASADAEEALMILNGEVE
jgi:hypothetical protein